MLCGICGESRKLVCGPCSGHLILRNRINLVKSQDQVGQLRAGIAESLSDPRTGGLDARITALEAKLSRTRLAIAQCRSRTAQVREQVVDHSVKLMALKTEIRQRENAYNNEISQKKASLCEEINFFEKNYKHHFHRTLACQSHCLRQVLEIFAVRRRRRRHGQPPDTLLGFGLVPDANSLLQYSASSINSGLDRVATFTSLCASYLGLQLPYHMIFSGHTSLELTMAHAEEMYMLNLTGAVRELLRSDPATFYAFCRSFAMLIINVATLGARLGVPKLEIDDVARLNELVTHIVLRIASQVHAGIEIQVYSAGLTFDVEAVQDHLITQAENAAHAGWSVVDAP